MADASPLMAIVNVALPTIRNDIIANMASTLQWIDGCCAPCLSAPYFVFRAI